MAVLKIKSDSEFPKRPKRNHSFFENTYSYSIDLRKFGHYSINTATVATES